MKIIIFIYMFMFYGVTGELDEKLNNFEGLYKDNAFNAVSQVFINIAQKKDQMLPIPTNKSISDVAKEFYKIFKPFQEEYGGKLGNAIFNAYEKNMIIPALIDYLKFLQRKKDNPNSALDILLTRLGKYRRDIALWATSKDNGFGVRGKEHIDDVLIDYVGQVIKWKPWSKAVIAKMMKIKEQGSRSKIRCDIDDGLQYRLGHHIIKICKGKIKYNTAGIDNSGDYELVLKDMSVDDIDKLSSDDINKKLKETRHKIKRISRKVNKTDEDREYIKHPDVALYFYHLNASIMEMPWTIDDFFTAIKSNIKLDDLKSVICTILWRFSHSTTYARGQAAITFWLLKGIAGLHKYELSFSENWQPPKYPNYDQQALLYLDMDEFLPVCRENMLLQEKK